MDNLSHDKEGQKICIQREMGKLGAMSEKENRKEVEWVSGSGREQISLVGETLYKTQHPDSYRLFAHVDEVKAAILQKKPQGFLILIKGSNSNRLVQTVDVL